MDSESQDPLESLLPLPDVTVPSTPQPQHASISDQTASEVGKLQANRISHATRNMTPPPSTQVQPNSRVKDRTPTPTFSSISTPPPTVEYVASSQQAKVGVAYATTLNAEQIGNASAEELREYMTELQSTYQDAKMSAAHYRLQYQMLSQESAAAIERMAVEARMAQYENDVIHIAEQAKAAATPVHSSPIQDGMMSVQKDLYQRMCKEIQQLTETTIYLRNESRTQDKIILKQEADIESLTDKVAMMRDRIRQNREHLNRLRRPSSVSNTDWTPRTTYSTPHRSSNPGGQDQFAALLQASEIASKEANPMHSGVYRSPSEKKASSARPKSHAVSSLPVTPHRYHKQQQPAMYGTPSRQHHIEVPSTAPLPRTSALRTPSTYSQPSLPSFSSVPIPHGLQHIPPAPQSEDTVSNSDRDVDSEAETDIIELNGEVTESQASRAASLMLRSSQDGSFNGSRSTAAQNLPGNGIQSKQSRLFGAVRKPGIDRDIDDRPSKRARTAEGVGLGILGARA